MGMDRPELNSSVRRYIAYVSTLVTTQLHLRIKINLRLG